MAIRNILPKENPGLRKISRPVDKISERLITLMDDMIETMVASDGVGLAAPQVGVLRRIVVLLDLKTEKGFELINPEIIAREGEQRELEGCLSCPGEYGLTVRPMKVTARGKNRKGETLEITREGLEARAICHELDHLEGVLFTDNATMVDPEEYENQ